jgi:multidrug efflux pump subunit AcrA (membrane-fusion protein)
MKRNLKNNGIIIAVLMALAILASCGERSDHADHADTYTCPMHPTVVADRPGTCPVCGMDLVRKARPGEAVEITEDLSKLIKSPNEVVVASVKTIKGEYKALPVTVQAQGVVTYDTRNIFTISARVGGRLEKVNVKYTFQRVAKGQTVAAIYSPELITAQRELLFLVENDEDNRQLIDAAERRLRLLGMSEGQIADLIERKETRSTFNVQSPYSGYVISGQQTAASPPPATAQSAPAGEMGDGMGAAPSKQNSVSKPQSALVREGDYVSAGQTLFTIVNNDALRLELDIPGVYSKNVRPGSKVLLDLGDARRENGTVDFVQPFFAEGQEFLKVRVYTNSTRELRVGHLVNASIQMEGAEGLWLPREAVLDLGLQKVVFIKERDVLKPKQVTTGAAVGREVEITAGLASSDEVAANAQFLVDSESFIKPAN